MKEVKMINQKKLKIGDKIPAFSLIGTDDKIYSLESFAQKNYVMIIFSCNHCPYVLAYEERIKSLQEEFRDNGFGVIAINSNDEINYPEDSFSNMKKRAEEIGFNFHYLRDETQQTAKAFGAESTPEIYLFDESRDLVYTGKIDDNWSSPEKVNNRYLRNAVLELIESKPVSVPETFAIGCSIKWKT